MITRVLCIALLLTAGACSSDRATVDDGPARAMERLPRDVRMAAEGYIDALQSLASILARVTDTASAREAMHGLESQLAALTRQWRALDAADDRKKADARYALYRSLSSADRKFDSQVARVKGTPGVGTILTPLLDKVPRWR